MWYVSVFMNWCNPRPYMEIEEMKSSRQEAKDMQKSYRNELLVITNEHDQLYDKVQEFEQQSISSKSDAKTYR